MPRADRLSARTHPLKDYLRQLERDTGRTAEDREHCAAQARALLREFDGARPSELNRLRSALECMEVGRDRSLPWEVRGVALDKAARILQSLGVIARRHKGATIGPTRRRGAGKMFTMPRPVAGGERYPFKPAQAPAAVDDGEAGDEAGEE